LKYVREDYPLVPFASAHQDGQRVSLDGAFAAQQALASPIQAEAWLDAWAASPDGADQQADWAFPALPAHALSAGQDEPEL